MICWFKQEECSHLMPAASLVYSKSVIECLLHCFLNIPRNIGDAFFYVITSTQAEKLWYCSFCFMCSIAMPYLLIKTSSPL